MTAEKLYYTTPTVYSWTTEILDIFQIDKQVKVILKETAFYPEGGGQPCDLGTIDGIEVLNVQKEGDVVIHFLKDIPKNKTVQCHVDRSRRLDFTQHHSGQHLLSATILELYNIPTVSFHLSLDSATIDIDTTGLTDEQLATIEDKVNSLVFENRKVNIFNIPVHEVERYSLRKIPPGHEVLRIVEIEGIEYNACGGTHVKSTAEIGLLKLLKTEKNKGQVRLYFICGKRLLNNYSDKLRTVNNIAKMLTTSVQNVEKQLDKVIFETTEIARKSASLFDEYSNLIVSKLIEKQSGTVIFGVFDQFTMKELTILSRKIIDHSRKIALVASKLENRILLTHNGEAPLHCGSIIKEHINGFSGKGGGDAKKAQAVFSTPEDLERFYQHLLSILQN